MGSVYKNMLKKYENMILEMHHKVANYYENNQF